MNGHIFQINASNGGVPKRPLRKAAVEPLGITVDKQENLKHHGGPERAVCLYSLDQILALQAEGHPIYPGSIGENVTISGVDWSQVQPGTRLRLGDEVILEVTSYAVPCRKIQGSFAGYKFGRVSQKANPGWARAYTRVLQTGQIQVGDKVVMEIGD
ncbi:MAG: MOSC domain-containing protein [Chloroflexota bacterium]